MRCLTVALLLAAAAHGQNCPDGRCDIYPPSRIVQSTPAAHGWYKGTDGRITLYWRGECAGTLDPISSKWQTHGKAHTVDLVETFGIQRPFEWYRSHVAAADPKIVTAPPSDDPFPGGVDASKIPQRLGYWVNTDEVSKKYVVQALTGAGWMGSLVDDRAKMFLTVVGDEATRKKVLTDLESNPALSPWKSQLHVNAYDPSDWQVSQVGLAPGITLQGPPLGDGTSPVLWRFREYTTAVALAEALRKADPNYKPDADPDPNKPQPKPTPSPTPGPDDPKPAPTPLNITMDQLKSIGFVVLLMVGGGLVVYLVRNRKV